MSRPKRTSTTEADAPDPPVDEAPESAPEATDAPPVSPTSGDRAASTILADIDRREIQALARLKKSLEVSDLVDELGTGKWYIPPRLRARLRGYHFVRIPEDNRHGVYAQTLRHLLAIGYVEIPPDSGIHPVGFPHDGRARYLMCRQEVRRRQRAVKLQKIAKAKARVGERFLAGARDIEATIGSKGSVEVTQKPRR